MSFFPLGGATYRQSRGEGGGGHGEQNAQRSHEGVKRLLGGKGAASLFFKGGPIRGRGAEGTGEGGGWKEMLQSAGGRLKKKKGTLDLQSSGGEAFAGGKGASEREIGGDLTIQLN